MQSECKECRKKIRKEYTIKNKEKIAATKKKYRESNKDEISTYNKIYIEENKEYYRNYSKQYYQDNIQHFKERDKNRYEENKEHFKKYRANNKERYKAWYKQYYKKNKGKYIINTQKRLAMKKKLASTLTLKQWELIKKDFDYKCAYCGQSLALEQEHFIALSNGGEYTHNNIIPACKSCNCSKNASDFFDWYHQQETYSKERENKILEYLNYTTKDIQQLALY